jgi:Xaa-Pro aminopeptidase
VLPGDVSVPVIVSDDGVPPQSTTLELKLNVRDDAANFTRLTGFFAIGNNRRAFLYDPSKDKKTELHEGDEFAVADLSGTIKQIDKKYVIVTMNQRDIRLDVGQSLREAQAKIKDYD